MRSLLNSIYSQQKVPVLIIYVICMLAFQTNSKSPNAVLAEDVTAAPVRLIPYHSLLSSMFQPVSKRRGQDLISTTINNIFPSRRYRRPVLRYPRPPSRYHNNGPRRFKQERNWPERKRHPTTKFNKYTKNYGRNRHPFNKPQNSFVPGGIVIDVQPSKH